MTTLGTSDQARLATGELHHATSTSDSTATATSTSTGDSNTGPVPVQRTRSSRREMARIRRELVVRQRRAQRLAELHHAESLLTDAGEIVRTGWLQHDWQAGGDVCLVGAILEAGGGSAAVDPQAVASSIDLAWHTMIGNSGEELRSRPAPWVRAARVGELARWNDQPGRRPEDVVGLLRAAGAVAGTERSRLQKA